jgi:hypothetical protein
MPPGSPTPAWSSRLGALLLSRPAAALASALTLLILLGCMSLTFGGLSIGNHTDEDGALCQEGDLRVGNNDRQDVYYPICYSGPPNLELSGDVDHCKVVEQKADHFTIWNPGPFDSRPHWKSRGVRVPAPVVMPPSPPPVVAPSALPPAPVPVAAPTGGS